MSATSFKDYKGVFFNEDYFYLAAGASVPPTTEEIDVYLDALIAMGVNTVEVSIFPNDTTDYRGTISELKLFPAEITDVYSTYITYLDFLMPHFERKGLNVVLFAHRTAGWQASKDDVVNNVGTDDRLVESTTPLREYMKQSCMDMCTIFADRYIGTYSNIIGVSIWDEPKGIGNAEARQWVWFDTFAECFPIIWAADPNMKVALPCESWLDRPNEGLDTSLNRIERGADFLWLYPKYYNQFKTTEIATTYVAGTSIKFGEYGQYPSHIYDNLDKLFLVPHVYRPSSFCLPGTNSGTANGYPWPGDYDDQDDNSQAYSASYVAQEFEPVIRTSKKMNVAVLVEAYGVQRYASPAAAYKWVRDMRKLFESHGWGYLMFEFADNGQNIGIGLPEWDDWQIASFTRDFIDATIDDGLENHATPWTGTSKRWQAMSDDLPSL